MSEISGLINSAEKIFGPSVNAIIVDFLVNSNNDVGRNEIETHVKNHIDQISQSNPEIKKRIPSGRESIIFWTDYLESNGVIQTTSKRPKKYIINPNFEGISALQSLRNSFVHRSEFMPEIGAYEESKASSSLHFSIKQTSQPSGGRSPSLRGRIREFLAKEGRSTTWSSAEIIEYRPRFQVLNDDEDEMMLLLSNFEQEISKIEYEIEKNRQALLHRKQELTNFQLNLFVENLVKYDETKDSMIHSTSQLSSSD